MPKIVSVSRRTDIPAFYGRWFLGRLQAGFAGWRNPFGGQRHLVSLARRDVAALVFWSKNFRPFLPVLETIRAAGYPAMFHYTITGLPREFEAAVVPPEDAIDSLREVSRRFGPEHVTWRYDPIVTSQLTDEAWHERRFAWLATRLRGHVTRCCFSFAAMYGKVRRSFAGFERAHASGFFEMDRERRVALAGRLAEIAWDNGMGLQSCCGEELIGGRITGAHCIDGGLLARLHPGTPPGRIRPTRSGCGCTGSADIGAYDSCPHGCIYCYANVNRAKAAAVHRAHDPESAFLGVPRAEADRWVEEILRQEGEAPGGPGAGDQPAWRTDLLL